MKPLATIIAALAFFGLSVIVLLPSPDAPTGSNASADKPILLTNATWFDGTDWHEGDLLIRNQLIEIGDIQLDEPYESIDLTGKFVIPGLIDAHTHTWGKALEQALKFGVTTEIDMFTQPSFARQARKQNSTDNFTNSADLFSAGTLVTSEGGHGTQFGFPIPTISSPEQAQQFVEDRLDEGSDFIKIVYHHKTQYGPFTSIDKATMEAVVKASHEQGALAVVHVSHLQAAKEAITAGADGLVHIFHDQPVDNELIELMQRQQAFVIPTLSVIASFSGASSMAFLDEASYVYKQLSPANKNQLSTFSQSMPKMPAAMDIAMENVRLLANAGITVLAGSDAPNPGTSHGISLHSELWWLVQSGMTEGQALQAGTSNINRAFNVGTRGLLTHGGKADFLILYDDPREDINASQSIDKIFKNGFDVTANVISKRTTALPSAQLNDFNSGKLRKEAGDQSFAMTFMATSDQMMNGNSHASVDFVDHTCNGSKALQVNGSISKAFPYPWAGLMVSFSDNMRQGYDLSLFDHLQFDVYGTEGEFRLMLFIEGTQLPIETTFTVTSSCNTLKIPLEAIDASLESVTAVAWVAGIQQDAFSLVIDNIEFVE